MGGAAGAQLAGFPVTLLDFLQWWLLWQPGQLGLFVNERSGEEQESGGAWQGCAHTPALQSPTAASPFLLSQPAPQQLF